MIIRAKAPMRISFAGGGTDTAPYMYEFGGCVLSTTIDKYAYATIEETATDEIEIVSIDFGQRLGFPLMTEMPMDGQLDLIKIAIQKILPPDFRKCGIKITTFSEIGPGSGLGSSSTMMVALVGALTTYANLFGMNRYELAEMAINLERVELGIKGGLQDQYAAVFGGFNFIEFGSKTIVNSLRINKTILNELNYHLVLVNTGDVRNAGTVSAELVKPVIDRPKSQIEACHIQRKLAVEIKDALLRGEFQCFGELMHEGWLAKRKMSSAVTNERIDSIYACAQSQGAIGGKLLGAGSGGHMLFYINPYYRRRLENALKNMGCSVVEFSFDSEGLQSWKLGVSPNKSRPEVAVI